MTIDITLKTSINTTKPDNAAPAVTLLSFLLDRTASMASRLDETIKGFNTYVRTLQDETKHPIRMTLVEFDSYGTDILYKAAPISEVANRTRENFVPRGNTPLIDACVEIIKATELQVADFLRKHGRTPQVMVIFQTDGEENCSRKYRLDYLRELRAEKERIGWAFVTMGANMDAYGFAGSVGIQASHTISYSDGNTEAAMRHTAGNTRSFAATGMSMNAAYTTTQKADSGDVWQKPATAAPVIPPNVALPARSKHVPFPPKQDNAKTPLGVPTLDFTDAA